MAENNVRIPSVFKQLLFWVLVAILAGALIGLIPGLPKGIIAPLY